ncbi:hypothetical protein A0H81_05428 [Grifola frondosa]|uniref:Casein kinase substrate phosphoprotein PP28 domain-containing protein n=1 Tax=Grifola frondosa TaxID=5627 RepID=A0A1C7MD78_GRIFR|nr:hypothetical protein A0H81_05428 [Grifola frondosa]
MEPAHTDHGSSHLNSKHLVLDENGTAVSTDKWYILVNVFVCLISPGIVRAVRGKRNDEEDDSDDDDEEEEEEEEEESEEEAPGGGSTAQPELSRTERRELKKKKAQAKQQAEVENDEDQEDQDPLFTNPNIAAGKRMNLADLGAPRELHAREVCTSLIQVVVLSKEYHREEKEKKEAKERYWKVNSWIVFKEFIVTGTIYQLHEQGKTEQAKADLSRLTKIRAEREAAQAKRKAEAEGLSQRLIIIPNAPHVWHPAKAAELETKKKEAAAKGKRL